MPTHHRPAFLLFLCHFASAIIVLPAPNTIDDVRLVNLPNVTLLVYNPAPSTVLGLHFASTGSFVAIVPHGRMHATERTHTQSVGNTRIITEAEEEALASALHATASTPKLISSADPAQLRHPTKFDLIYADKASKLRVWRPQPLDETWFPAGDVFTVGTKRPPSLNHVWLLPSSCLEEFTGYASARDGQQRCNTLGQLSKGSTHVIRACEAVGDAQGATGTVWLAKDPCSVPPFCPKLSCLTVPGASYPAQESGMYTGCTRQLDDNRFQSRGPVVLAWPGPRHAAMSTIARGDAQGTQPGWR